MGLLIALVILAFFIVFHELGHFIVARACGVQVEVFSLGFGKKILSFEFKGTRYAISAIPLGGYVQLKGQQEAFIESKDSHISSSHNSSVLSNAASAQAAPNTQADTQAHSHDSFLAKSPLQRIAILLAGSGFNFLLGFLLYVCVCLYGVVSVPSIVGEVVDSMSAQAAGILPGDRILSVNGVQIRTWEELAKAVQDCTGVISLYLQRGDSHTEITLTPKLIESHNIFGESTTYNVIGITASQQTQIVRYTRLEALTKAWEKTIESSKLILQSLQKLISGVVSVQHISSVVGITHMMASYAQSDIVALLALSALISINLGIFNLLPIPPLDGGHILFTLYESLTHKKPNERIANAIVIIGVALLLGLMSLGVYNDINRIIAP
ncbi:RIP metalloprotease RseP [uncultured Helicobacter sp.]|uniref:RIP metalloprotease RseP n=1 Tax=uncultured Helicobacter sp. TaxID=175537 RepID=UPI00374F55C4